MNIGSMTCLDAFSSNLPHTDMSNEEASIASFPNLLTGSMNKPAKGNAASKKSRLHNLNPFSSIETAEMKAARHADDKKKTEK
ncbi:hypothetical protein OPT61_g155 [Boeremia exigua]|uniref:Uncharacterized protein n=1 Tax=Boeremia exigua TaxID=749465 RepID=A0ACC2IV64_9PLEO|nr:hypothetical protein OPT61_g155 [Boeremia exigua]